LSPDKVVEMLRARRQQQLRDAEEKRTKERERLKKEREALKRWRCPECGARIMTDGYQWWCPSCYAEGILP
jgi:rubrerythrin